MMKIGIKTAVLYAELEKFMHEMAVDPLEAVGCEVEMVRYVDVARGKLKGFDVAFCLGSVGVLFWTSIHPSSFLFRFWLRRFVRRGGGVVGHCAGSGAFAEKFVTPQIGNLSFKGAGLLDVETTFPYALNELTDLIAGFMNMEELIGTVEYLEGNVIGVTPGKQRHFYDTGCAFGEIGDDVDVLARVVTCYKDGLEGNPYDVCGTYGKGRVVLTNGNPELAMPFNLLVFTKLLGADLLPLDLSDVLEPPDWKPDLETLRAQVEWAAKKR